MIFHRQFHLPVFKCALVKLIGLLCQHAAEETALNGFRGPRVRACTLVCVRLLECLCVAVRLQVHACCVCISKRACIHSCINVYLVLYVKSLGEPRVYYSMSIV